MRNETVAPTLHSAGQIRPIVARALLAGAIAAASTGALGAQGSAPPRSAPPRAPHPVLLVMDLSFYGANANSIQPGDSAAAQVATARLRITLRESGAFALVDSARAAAAVARAESTQPHCNASIACAREVARALGATWVVAGTVSKTSNLIWYLSGQLVDVASGRVALDDGFELKGARDDMVPRGAESLARRVQRAASREMSSALAPD